MKGNPQVKSITTIIAALALGLAMPAFANHDNGNGNNGNNGGNGGQGGQGGEGGKGGHGGKGGNANNSVNIGNGFNNFSPSSHASSKSSSFAAAAAASVAKATAPTTVAPVQTVSAPRQAASVSLGAAAPSAQCRISVGGGVSAIWGGVAANGSVRDFICSKLDLGVKMVHVGIQTEDTSMVAEGKALIREARADLAAEASPKFSTDQGEVSPQ